MTGRFLRLAWKSLANRRGTTFLTVLTIALSVTVLLGVEKIRAGARLSFANTVTGTDLIVGARGGQTQLLLYAVFRIGDATNNLTWESYEDIASRPEVAWTIPLSLGDSHRGFRVVGTNEDYFRYYRYGRDRPLAFTEGEPFEDLFDAVLGADVAKSLGYRIGDSIVLAHGVGDVALTKHADKPFRVAGILEATGTPVDRSVHVSLEAIEAIHIDWVGGMAPLPGTAISADEVRALNLTPTALTAFLVGLHSRLTVFEMQRAVNTYPEEPLLAILPGATLQSFWDGLGTMEAALVVVSALVVASGVLGMITVSLAGLNERRREIAVLRSVGARPLHIFLLLELEAVTLAAIGAAVGLALVYGLMAIVQPIIEAELGLFVPILAPSARELAMLGLVLVAGLIAGMIPAYRAYRMTVADGLMVAT